MSLNMYLGEVQSQTQSMNAVCTATIQGMEQAIQSIDAFTSDTVLQGQTYDSAKAFFAETFRPLAQGIIYLCEELIRQNDAFPSQFQSQVAQADVIEQEILEQIREIDRMKASMEAITHTMPIPGMDAMANLFTVMRKKLQEKLDHLYEFNQTSSNNYDTALQLATSIATGLAEVQSGKGFSPTSGTFSTQGLNMEWATSIQAIEEDRARKADNSIKDGEMCGRLEEKSPIRKAWDDKVDDVVKMFETVKKMWNGTVIGTGKAVEDEIKSMEALSNMDIGTFINVTYAILHLDETTKNMWHAFSSTVKRDIIDGDAESITQWTTYGLTQIGIGLILDRGLGRAGLVTKGAGGASTLAKGVTLVKELKQVSDILQPVKKDVSYAFSGGNNIRSKFDIPDFKQAEEKLSTHQFANSGGNTNTNAIKPGDTSPLAPGGGLIAHEAKPGQRRGGHLIKKHVEKTDAELLQRLQSDPRIPASSSFTNRAIAERVANEVLSNPQNIAKINRWLNNPNSRPTLPLRYNGNSILGRYVERGSNGALDVENAVIVLKKDNQGSFIITGYPEK
ncbi:RNase A-like domain-containing protein [Bacillus toyonensis]|uniref:RNase A-like domain-containing protein n=1 Tax=Bacillus toyonensis TaxID=155322 RepID=UPI000BF6E7B5|nr:RNase A-like domain-containing protein [Bacillus toyonensis]PGB46915.1 cytoplasmic protein [Bacillus toyonensis]PGE43097.1 cytoplasmic protein [Bacillus toyonensis]